MKLMGVKRNFQVLLVPNYRAFQITVIYVSGDLLSRLGDPAKTTKTSYKTSEIINLFLLLSLSNIENIRFDSCTNTPLFTT